ncbi:hypothetical protein [Mariniplasma anaerobium]|uniref:Uncharacterized protein n=1 Tax=Mariniplasma anaerobium TaxID=2735436 RepID=A0A7U9THP3_9MOLU|nr:hypothetical protein [Mariniplasma anaerobium]BCR36688.1 hypothetical protein MPAN_015810 [Mariniplasma anaerobium]
MKKERNIILLVIGISGTVVFLITLTMLFFGDELELLFNVIGIRVAAVFVAFAAFLSSMLFSLLILLHNKTTVKINDDTNKRAELFRELQFASSNYSIIDFMDRMLIYEESSRYVDRVINKKNLIFHMIESGVHTHDIFTKRDDYLFFSIKIPFKIIEGKIVSSITFDKLRFERDGVNFEFMPPENETESRAYILYNEQTKRNNVIINLVMKKDSSFYKKDKINIFSKIKIYMNVTSLLGVKVEGNSELYFTNPEQIEGDGSNTYHINSSNFILTDMPKIINR